MKLAVTGRVVLTCFVVLGAWRAAWAQVVFPPPTPQTVFPAADWQVVKPEVQQMSSAGLEKVGAWLKAAGSKTGLVIRHGQIVGEWYFDEAKQDSKYLVYSTTKSFASTAAGLAIASGKLKLDSKVGDFFPNAEPPEKRDVTVRQLLSMTSGAHSDNNILQKKDLFSYILTAELPMDDKPGEKWVYNNSGLSLLAPVIQKATGQDIDQILEQQVFKKIGISPDDWSWEDRDGTPLPYSGLHITARSLARFGLMILNKGKWEGKNVVPPEWVALATHTSQDLNKRYGFLWWNNSTGHWPGVPSDAFAALGRFDNNMLMVPSLDLIVIRQVGDDTGNKRDFKIDELFSLAVAAVDDRSPSLQVPDSASKLEVEPAFPKLKFNRPILLTHAGDGTNRLFVPSQLGKVHVFANNQDAAETKTFLDLEPKTVYKDQENETGFLGLAFHPKYRENGQFFVYYTPTGVKKNTVVVSRFRVSKDDPNRADPDSEEQLLSVEQPFWNHKGGTLAFGPDGYLYIALGDGGLGNDPYGNGQSLTTLLGKILRIDVDHQDPGKKYAIPKDNPFLDRGEQALGEIWAYGLRNPWRIAFDRQTGTLWCGDVGQDLWEEIDLITKGGNYGWNHREGLHRFGTVHTMASDLVQPIWEYYHETGKSITGGNVYRGKRLPELVGCYLYADYVSGKVWALKYDETAKKVVANYSIPGNVMPIISFGEDEPGEVYYTTDTGNVFRFRSVQQTAGKSARSPSPSGRGEFHMISIHDVARVNALRRRLKIDRYPLRRLRNAFYKEQRGAESALNELPEGVRDEFAAEVEFHSLTLESRHDSQLDGASKLIFRTSAGQLIESVILRIASGRTTLCVSTQVGCAANCEFCATGKMGIARNLSASEIVDQLVQANRLLDAESRSVRSLVFMGMGEPFHNESALYGAIDVLTDGGSFNMSPKRILVSTVGIPAAMVRCARSYPGVRQALSLHSARDDVRRSIMPIAQRHGLAELREALVEVASIQGQLVMIEYLLLKDLNDREEDAAALAEYLRGIPVHINLVPYNPIAEAPHLAASEPERRAAFSTALKTAGYPVTTRYSLGADVAAACGQLVRQEHRRHKVDAASCRVTG